MYISHFEKRTKSTYLPTIPDFLGLYWKYKLQYMYIPVTRMFVRKSRILTSRVYYYAARVPGRVECVVRVCMYTTVLVYSLA